MREPKRERQQDEHIEDPAQKIEIDRRSGLRVNPIRPGRSREHRTEKQDHRGPIGALTSLFPIVPRFQERTSRIQQEARQKQLGRQPDTTPFQHVPRIEHAKRVAKLAECGHGHDDRHTSIEHIDPVLDQEQRAQTESGESSGERKQRKPGVHHH